MEREVRYCSTEDGVRIAYCVEGEGPAMLYMPAFVESFELFDQATTHLEWFRSAYGSRGRRVVSYDMRGVGLSQRDVQDFSLNARLLDVEAVVAAAELGRFSLYALVTSGPLAITYAATHPERVSNLILYETFARVEDVYSAEMLKSLAMLARANWPLAAQTLADLGPARRVLSLDGVVLAKLLERSTSGEVVAAYVEAGQADDVTPLLGDVRARTLVLQRRQETHSPTGGSHSIAAGIKDARFVTVDISETYDAEDSRHLRDLMNAFLDEDPEARRVTTASRSRDQGLLRTILFTDLVGHTEMMQRLGDDRGRDVLREHERITREVLKAHGGTEIKTMGDGFLASFGSITKAVECAIALQKAFAGREGEPLSVRCGLNAGEPIEEEGDLFGTTVILASRIAAKADGGEILVANTVRELCAGKGFSFTDRGEFAAKGFDEPVRLYEVRWQKDA